MMKARLFDFSLFFAALAVVFLSEGMIIENHLYLKALFVYWLFSSLYYHLRGMNKKGNIIFDYGIIYSLSFGIFTGPLGLFIFETILRFTIYLTRKRAKTADPGEFLDTFYNIGSFVLTNSLEKIEFRLKMGKTNE